MKTIIIDGARITDIPSFYTEINRVFMAGEAWMLGASLDAFDDMLYGNYGAIDGAEPVTLLWSAFEESRLRLGKAATRSLLLAKMQQPDRFDMDRIATQLEALDRGEGQTYFDTIMAIITDHGNITLLTSSGPGDPDAGG